MEKIFQKLTNWKQKSHVAAIFVTDRDEMSNFYRCFLPSVDSFDQAVSEEKLFKNVPIRNKNCLWRRCLLTKSGRNGQSLQRTFHRCFLPRFGPFGQAVSEQKIFRNRPIRNKNCLQQPCLLMDQDKMSTLYREPSIVASYQVSVHLAKWFQRTRFLEIDQLETRIACGSYIC